MRRRDGLTLAATGAIPARVRAQVLAEHRAQLQAHSRARLQALVSAGLRTLPIPYGYRRTDHHLATIPDPGPHQRNVPSTESWADLPPNVATATVDRARGGQARPIHWRTDPDCAETIWFMASLACYDTSPARIADLLNTTSNDRPPLLDSAGRPRRWTARAVRDLLTNPLLTGHSVWGRTRHGRPVPPRPVDRLHADHPPTDL